LSLLQLQLQLQLQLVTVIIIIIITVTVTVTVTIAVVIPPPVGTRKESKKKKPCPGANARAGLVERAGTRSSGEQVQSGHPTLRNSTITIIDASYCTVQYSTVRGNLLATPLDGTSWFSSRYRFCWSKRSYPSG